MAGDNYVWCLNCNEIYHATPFAKAPVYGWDGKEPVESPMDDWRVFTRAHAGHRLEPLRSVGEPFRPRGADPMSERFIEVTDGRRRFVVRAFRRSIAEPLSFELIPGQLQIAADGIAVQEKEIRHEMKRHFPWRASGKIDGENIELVIAALKEIVSTLSPDQVQISGFDSREGSLLYGLLPESSVQLLLRKCATFLGPEQLSELERFIDSENAPDGVLSLILRRRFEIASEQG